MLTAKAMTTITMDATGVRSTGSSSVASFEKICLTAEKNSSLSLLGHMSGDAYLSALANSVCEYTGVDVSCWGLGSQFNIGARGADKLPAGLLAPSFQHLSKTCAADFFGESDSLDTYQLFANGVKEFVHSGRAAAEAIHAEQNLPSRPKCMSKTSFSVAQARDLIIAVASVSALDTRQMIHPKVQLLDEQQLTLLAQTFNVATGEDPDVYDNSITDAIMEVFAAARYTTPVFVRSIPSPDTSDLRSMGFSLRDENVADDAARARWRPRWQPTAACFASRSRRSSGVSSFQRFLSRLPLCRPARCFNCSRTSLCRTR